MRGYVSSTKYEEGLILRCIHNFKSNIFNNMVHMRISGSDPSLLILGQTNLELESDVKKFQNKLKPTEWCNKPTEYDKM